MLQTANPHFNSNIEVKHYFPVNDASSALHNLDTVEAERIVDFGNAGQIVLLRKHRIFEEIVMAEMEQNVKAHRF